ncbi:calcium-binding and coiled-coil domain-containing protein 2 isoform X2 [Mugil cephalus]|uniref:calcium-binding and coiled-coil domain-containing protein 2 isoform X2 n=1 Tax=Mugil cephalus TaxID=48193 RepID=UPI001FB7CF0E|nr:calcium-binding and coiled-coil domain-containing protein 2 isoform X2 [Mugil cephalus]
MESPTEAAADSSAPTFSQVVFIDIPHSYPPSTHVTCCYTIAPTFQPNPRDWVGIFKVGWSTTKDYHTFVWVEPCQDVEGQQPGKRYSLFRDYYLPKDEIEFYQFCYVDSSGQVRGASTPFCFKNPVEQNLESSMDDDLLVITTQEQVEQSLHEKAKLQRELDQMRAENEALKSALQREQQEVACSKGRDGEKEKEMAKLVKELDQVKEQSEKNIMTLREQLKEKEEMLIQMAKQMEIQQQNEQKKLSQSLNLEGTPRPDEEKYSRAVMKINQLKEERDKLNQRIDLQRDEITRINAKFREQERELFKTKDHIQLLEVDLQSSRKEKQKLAAELQKLQSLAQKMDEVTRENQDLQRRLSQQEIVHISSDDDLKVQCQTLSRQLQDAQMRLTSEREECKNMRRAAELKDEELHNVKDQLEKVVDMYNQEQRKSSKYELQLKDAHEAIADKNIDIDEFEKRLLLAGREKEELARENEELRGNIEGIRRLYAASALTAGDASATHEPQGPSQEEAPLYEAPLYESIGSIGDQQQVVAEEEESLVCRHCQERFPGITQNELEQHEQSHKVCPFCTMICDNMDQAVFEDHVYSHEV